MVRSPCCEKVGLKRGRWTAEEDAILIKYIQQNGEGSWKFLPKNAGLLRCGKSCRLRWINYLRSDLKRGNFTTEEEEIIIQFHRSLGNRWSVIASHLPGRTDNEVKNYWNSHLSRKLYSFTSNKTNGCGSILKTTAIDLMINMASSNTTKRRGGGRVSRSKSKKHDNTHSTKSVSMKKEDIISTDALQYLSTTKKDRVDVVAGLMEKHDRLASSITPSPKELETFDNQDDCFLTTALLDQDWTLALNDGTWDLPEKSFSTLKNEEEEEEEELINNNEWDFNSVAAYGNVIWDEDNDNMLWF